MFRYRDTIKCIFLMFLTGLFCFCQSGCSSKPVLSEARREIKNGIKLYEKGNYLSSISELEAGLRIIPKDRSALKFLAYAYEDIQDFEKSINAWQRYMFVTIPTSPDAKNAQKDLDRVKMQLRAKSTWQHLKEGQNISECKLFVERYPDSIYTPNVYFLLAKSLESENEIEEARIYYQMIVDKFPKTPFAQGAKKRLERQDAE